MSESPKNSRVPYRRVLERRTPLDEQLDKLKAKWVNVERQLLEKTTPPRHVWISYYSKPSDLSNPEGDCYEECLGIARWRGEWRLCVGEYFFPAEQKPGHWKPITECSFEERLEAVQGILKLERKIEESQEELGPRIEKAIEKLDSAIMAMLDI